MIEKKSNKAINYVRINFKKFDQKEANKSMLL